MLSNILSRVILRMRRKSKEDVASIVVLSDLRLPILAAALQVSRRHCNSYILFSTSIIKCNEYGSESFSLWKALKLLFVCLAFKPLITDKQRETEHESILGIYSSLVSASFNHKASPLSHPVLWQNFKTLSDSSQALCDVIQERRITEVFIFNGRLASVRPLADFCSRSEIKCWFMEYGNVPFHFTLQSYPVHDYISKANHVIATISADLYFPSKYEMHELTTQYFGLLVNNRFTGSEVQLDSFDICIILSSPHETMYAYSDIAMDYAAVCRTILSQRGKKVKAAIKMHPNMMDDPSWPSLYSALTLLCSHVFDVVVFDPTSRISALSIIEASAEVCIPSSSLSIVAECLGRKVYTLDPLLSRIIAYARESAEGSDERSYLLQRLYLATLHLNQQAYHPTWLFLMKLFGPLDFALVFKRNLSLRKS